MSSRLIQILLLTALLISSVESFGFTITDCEFSRKMNPAADIDENIVDIITPYTEPLVWYKDNDAHHLIWILVNTTSVNITTYLFRNEVFDGSGTARMDMLNQSIVVSYSVFVSSIGIGTYLYELVVMDLEDDSMITSTIVVDLLEPSASSPKITTSNFFIAIELSLFIALIYLIWDGWIAKSPEDATTSEDELFTLSH